MRSMTARCAAVGLASTVWNVVTTGMVTRQQFEDVAAGFATENSEFVLQAHGVEPAGIQEVCCTDVFFDLVILDLKSDRLGIIIGLAMIGHRHDAGLESRA